MSLIDTILEKPEKVRRKILLISSLTITFVIILIWIISLSISPVSNEIDFQKEKSSPNSFTSIKEDISILYKEAISKIKENR